jgi:hypothetical protein
MNHDSIGHVYVERAMFCNFDEFVITMNWIPLIGHHYSTAVLITCTTHTTTTTKNIQTHVTRCNVRGLNSKPVHKTHCVGN